MFTRSAILLILFVTAVSSSYANESERIEQLEKEIQEINERLAELESILKNQKEKKLVLSDNGWKSLTNWRMLKEGMNYSAVEKILGEPHRVNGGSYAIWYYKNNGDVRFIAGKVSSWSEPR